MNQRIVASVLAGLVAAGAASCSRRQETAPEPPRPVRTMTVGTLTGETARTFSGRARPAIGTMLSFRVGGEISDLYARIGAVVRANDVIAKLDATDYELRVRQLEAQLAQADAQLKQASSDYGRTRGLYEAGNASRSELDRARALSDSAQAQWNSVAKGLDLARQQLDYCTLRAPMDGTITTVPIDVHTLVQPGTPVAGLSAGDAMEIETGVPEALIGSLRVGDAAKVVFDTLPDAPFEANITEVSVEANEVTTYPVRLALRQRDARILAGMVCSVTFDPGGSGEAPLIIPVSAVVGGPGGERFVWIVDAAASRVTRRDVAIGPLTTAGVRITAGLGPGDIVVTRGVHMLEEGMAVRLQGE
jgi:RND family efflux transporter MFP subunit